MRVREFSFFNIYILPSLEKFAHFFEKLSIYSSSIIAVQRTTEIIKIITMSADHLATILNVKHRSYPFNRKDFLKQICFNAQLFPALFVPLLFFFPLDHS